MAEKAARKRRSRSRGTRANISTEQRLDDLEARIEALERAVSGGGEEDAGQGISRCSEIIGCLDDCVTDVRELRKRVRDARS